MSAQPEVLPITTTEVAEYTETARGLAELRQQLEGMEFDCTTTEGDKLARESRRALVSLRTTLEAKRKELKAPLLERTRLIDAEAKRITGEIVELELPIDQQIKAEEARREAIRAERARVEQARIDGHKARIQSIRDRALEFVAAPVGVIEQAIAEAGEVADDFEEFQDEAEAAHGAMLEKLTELLEHAKERERHQAELRAQREEQERRRQEEEARLAAEREKLERERREQEARIAEKVRIAEEERREAEEAARRERERIAAEQAERERVLAEREAEYRRVAEEAEAQRKAEEAARAAKEEQDAIDAATLFDAARDVLALLARLGQADTLEARKLNAALAREFEVRA